MVNNNFLDKIPDRLLKRNYGINDRRLLALCDNEIDVNIRNLKSKIIKICISDNRSLSENYFYFWGLINDNSFIPIIINDEMLLTTINLLIRYYNRIDSLNIIFLSSTKNLEFYKIEKIITDVTNFHFRLVAKDCSNKEKSYRFKWYTRPFKGYKEFITQMEINEKRPEMVAEPLLLVAVNNDALFAIYEEIDGATNVDELTGNLYINWLNNDINNHEFEESFSIHIDRLFQLLEDFHRNISISGVWQSNSVIERRKLVEILNNNINGLTEKMTSLSSIKGAVDKIIAEISSLYDHTSLVVCHGDIWLRQFAYDSVKNSYFLFDFEDVFLAPVEYDFACLMNSIIQQREYFRCNYGFSRSQLDVSNKIISSFYKKLIERNLCLENIGLCQKIRAIHELNYSLQHQKELSWLIEVLQNIITGSFSF